MNMQNAKRLHSKREEEKKHHTITTIKYKEIENERKIEWNSFLNDITIDTHTQVLLVLLLK